ncbi:ketosteroid isomerase-like protein [Methylobacterium sp. BE186]|uniref:YybH family protein n=1 Tax=Methylobacterium sp. BE186 TaxID=2817715 RepID=UPI002861C630|nr:ketosteroid isomerase family protein [Methylobacterium sp. BE186]MDR7039199.1 ketosteroid isomerase-like protein [Methylobacterium sp. BE186]
MSTQGQAIADQWNQSFNKGDTAALGKLYSENGQVFPAGSSPVQGPQAIAAFFADLQTKGFKDHKITVQDATERSDILILTGRW